MVDKNKVESQLEDVNKPNSGSTIDRLENLKNILEKEQNSTSKSKKR